VWLAIYSLLVEYNKSSGVDYLSWLSGISLMHQRPLDTYM